jgi:endonuclease/exonuclease/phosphatase family metal-dependent hydrolase
MYNKVCILTIYRSPKGNFKNFLKRLVLILQKLYDNKHNFIICGDVNVNYLSDNKDKSQLNVVLHSYNLSSTVTFPTRIGLHSHTAIDNVFTDTPSIGKYYLYPLTNGLSDHDSQY